ncbi:MAG: methionyl-tRNA formyltransferase [Clostridia bacterium]|nr:methionyl-tRNA formyltransferase [Clostridia bacterium]
MKIVFAGTPEFAVKPLKALIAGGYNVVAVITQTDKPVGRKAVLTPSPVAVCAQEAGIPVYKFDKIRSCAEDVKAIGADVMFTCAYGQILTQQIIDIFPCGIWNAHASLLPDFRGASPIQSAILAGKRHTGVTVMKTELALDSGDMLLVKKCEIAEGETYGSLSEKLSDLAAQALCDAADLIIRGDVATILQDDSAATYCKKITKEDAKINFALPAAEVANRVNAMDPSPAAYCLKGGSPVNIFKALPCTYGENNAVCGQVVSVSKNGIIIKCGDGYVNVAEAQFAGGKRLKAADIANGRKLAAGDLLD